MKPEKTPLSRFEDDRGNLTQIFDSDIKPKRAYHIFNPRGIIRSFHGHFYESKYIYVVSGAIKVICFPIRDWCDTTEFIISSDVPSILYVPKGYYHGYISLRDSHILVFSDRSLIQSKKDDMRMKPDETLLKLFEVEPR